MGGEEREVSDARVRVHGPPQVAETPEFRQLFDAECSFVWNVLRRLGLPERELEDGVQDVFIVVHRHLGEYDPQRPLRPWLFGICYRVVIAHRRLSRTTHERLSGDEVLSRVADTGPAIDEQVEARQARDLVRRALDMLDLDRRALIVMFEYEGYSMPEIAEILAVPLNTAYSRLRLAREQFVGAVRRLQSETTVRSELAPLRKGGAR